MRKRFLICNLILTLSFTSCKERIEKVYFPTLLDEMCMIVNQEQNNLIEGNYLRVQESNPEEQYIIVKLPDDFLVNSENFRQWIVGWGTGIPLYDAGPENLRPIIDVNKAKNEIRLGGLLRGNGFPADNQRIVFWNTRPSGFYNYIKEPVINPRLWPGFDGDLVCFGGVEYDSLIGKWVMIINEVGDGGVQIYAASSDNLINWYPENDGDPIIRPSDFKGISWGDGNIYDDLPRTPFVSDIIRHKGTWYLFMYGFGQNGLRYTGVAISDGSLLGHWVIYPDPLLSPGRIGAWDEVSTFFPVIAPYKDGYIMFYNGRNTNGLERVGMAKSTDLLNWEKSPYNPVINQHRGWRSKPGVSEPNYLEIRNDSILLMVAGAKQFKMGPWHHYITRRMYMDVSGNVDDAQLGFFLSVDGGISFKPHSNNPIFINDYSNLHENEHMGGNFKRVVTDTAELIFYQAKSSYERAKYNILLREKKINF